MGDIPENSPENTNDVSSACKGEDGLVSDVSDVLEVCDREEA